MSLESSWIFLSHLLSESLFVHFLVLTNYLENRRLIYGEFKKNKGRLSELKRNEK